MNKLCKGIYLKLINFFALIFQKFIHFIVIWNEIITIPVGIIMFYFTPRLMRMVDPTSGGYDLGILHSVIFAIAAMLIIHGFAFLLLKISFPKVYQFINDVFEDLLYQDERTITTNLTKYQKCVLSLFLLALYLLGTILLVRIF